jgi:hypothetical protein
VAAGWLEAVIGGIFAVTVVVVGWGLKKFDARNTAQHAENLGVLKEIRDDVKDVQHRLSDHIEWHLKEDVR